MGSSCSGLKKADIDPPTPAALANDRHGAGMPGRTKASPNGGGHELARLANKPVEPGASRAQGPAPELRTNEAKRNAAAARRRSIALYNIGVDLDNLADIQKAFESRPGHPPESAAASKSGVADSAPAKPRKSVRFAPQTGPGAME